MIIRQLVNTKEWITACMYRLESDSKHANPSFSPGRGKKGQLRKNLRNAKTYEVRVCMRKICDYTDLQLFPQEWKQAAVVLDEYLGFQEWKKADEDPFYDWMLVRKVSFFFTYVVPSSISAPTIGEALAQELTRERRYTRLNGSA